MRKEISKYRKNALTALALALLLTTVLVVRLTWLTSSPNTWFVGPVPPAHFATIQEAIYNETVMEGDIIEVMPEGGPYYGGVVVNKSLTIRRQLGDPDECIIDGNETYVVINVTASNVKIFNFTIQNGIYGLYLSRMSANNIIVDNKVALNGYGVFIDGSRNNTLSRNELSGNVYNFVIGPRARVLADFIQHIDQSNTVNGKPIYYWVNEHDKPVPTFAGYIALVNCTNITIEDSALANNYQGMLIAYTNHSIIENVDVRITYCGIQLWHSHNNTIRGNIILHNVGGIDMYNSTFNAITNNYISEDNATGIYLSHCSNNTFTDNDVTQSGQWGICTWYSYNNTFYHNNMMNGALHQAWSIGSSDTWDNGAEGNYWNDYQGVDEDGDGIIDDPYDPPHDPDILDRYPLVEPWSPIKSLNITWKDPSSCNQYHIQYFITTHSDHVVASIKCGPALFLNGFVTFNITAGSQGYCNVTIPRDRLDHPFYLLVDAAPANYNLVYNATHCSLYFVYTSGTHNIQIISKRIGKIFGDLDGDGKVDMMDIRAVTQHFGDTVADP